MGRNERKEERSVCNAARFFVLYLLGAAFILGSPLKLGEAEAAEMPLPVVTEVPIPSVTALPTAAPTPAPSQSPSFRIVKKGGKRYLYRGESLQKNKWGKVGDNWYHANKKGLIETKKWIGKYYVDKKGRRLYNTWVKGIYYVGPKGKKVKKTWLEIEGETYHFDKKGRKDTSKWIGKRYVDDKGRWIPQAVKGSFTGTSFLKPNGKALKNRIVYTDGSYYYFDRTGAMVKDTWILYQKVWYYFQADGTMALSRWVKGASPALASTDAYWLEFFTNLPWRYVDAKGQLLARKSKTVKWNKTLEVVRTLPQEGEEAPEDVILEGYYTISPKKGKTGYYQWVKKTGNTIEDYRQIHVLTDVQKDVAFARGGDENPWCIQLSNCIVESQE